MKQTNLNNRPIEITKEIITHYIENSEFNLNSTHNRLCIPIINRIYKKMKRKIIFNSSKVYQDLVIDGHHRYVSSILAGIEVEQLKTLKTSATESFNWNDVEFVEEEWDTKEKIDYLNKLDAEYNNIPLDEIIKIIS